MKFTYDLTDPIGLVRRNIGDTTDADLEAGAGVRWNGSNITDDEIVSYFGEYGDHVDVVTAHCLLMLSSEYASKATTLQMGSIREEMENASAELRRSANVWFSQVAARERRTADSVTFGSSSSGTLPVVVIF